MNQTPEQRIGWNRAVEAAAMYLESWGDRLGDGSCQKKYKVQGVSRQRVAKVLIDAARRIREDLRQESQ